MPAQQLVADLAKKSGLVWVSYGGRDHAVWHEWVGDAIAVVAGGGEQQLPGIADQQVVTVKLRSKTTRALAAETQATVEVVAPGSEHWESVTTALRTGRLNLVDSKHAVQRWAAGAVVVRLVPIGTPTEAGRLPSDIGHTSPRLSR